MSHDHDATIPNQVVNLSLQTSLNLKSNLSFLFQFWILETQLNVIKVRQGGMEQCVLLLVAWVGTLNTQILTIDQGTMQWWKV